MKKYIAILGLVFAGILSAEEYNCETKYCKNMSSCDEAFYKLKVCDHKELDRDGNGVPCEKICGKGGKLQTGKSKKLIKDKLREHEVEQSEEKKSTTN